MRMYISTYNDYYVYSQNEKLRNQLRESKRNEKVLLEQVNKAEQKLSALHENYEKLKAVCGSEEIESQLSTTKRKFNDVKSKFGSIGVIKMHYTKEVKKCS